MRANALLPTEHTTPAHVMDMPDQSGVAVVATALIGIAALAWLALRALPTAPPLPADAPAALFAAERTTSDHQFLAQAARPVGSAANMQARAYIVGRMRAMGLTPEVQSATAQHVTRRAGGAAEIQAGLAHNIVLHMDGSAPDRARRPALLVATHYDSPGADSGAPVAAMLETVRALSHGPVPANDVIFLWTDGEHAGALGARAFASQHRWAKRVGMVLQFDAAGGNGPLLLTGSRGGNGNMVAGWVQADAQAQGSSALELLASRAPGLRQGEPLDQLGTAGMRFAQTGEPGQAAPATRPPAANQQTGSAMLALIRHFGSAQLSSIASADRIYFNLPFAGQVHYSTQYVWPLTRLTCLMALIACCIAVKRSGVPARTLVAGAMAFFAIAAGVAIAALTAWRASGAPDGWALLAVITLGAAVFIAYQRLLQKAIGLPAALLGALLVMLALLVGVSWKLSGASYLLAWPIIGAVLAYGALQAPRIAALPGSARLAILIACSVPAVLLFAPLLPQMSALMAAGRAEPNQAQGARSGQLTYLKDAATWKTWWVLPAKPGQLAAPDGVRVPAPPSAIAHPELAVLRDEEHGGRRHIALTVRSKNNAPTLQLRVEGTSTLRASLDGTLLTERPASAWSISLHGTAGRKHRFEFAVAPGNSARVFVEEHLPGLPAGTKAPQTGLTVASDTLVFR